jgi:predicted metalloprotease with PDZ domain
MTRRRAFVFLRILVVHACIACANVSYAQTPEPIRYTLSFPAPLTHYVEVEATFPSDAQAYIDLMMPVWTPGSYLVREYARNVEALTATDSNHSPLVVQKTRKNRWRVQTNGAKSVAVHYRVYAHEMSVRTNWVDDEFALLNGAPTFITLAAGLNRPHEVRLVLPAAWGRSISPMPGGSAPNSFRAPDYDTLVDSPIVAGNPAVYEFTVAGKRHYLVDVGEGGVWDGKGAVQDLAKIVRQTTEFWRVVPYDSYYFFNIIGGIGGGLEHKNSTVLNPRRESTTTRADYLGWLSTASHEFFHAWNVKRLRPIELGPFDYENEVYTRSLWFVEGVTDYYADLQSRRAGVSTPEEHLASLSAEIANLQTTPGRFVQPAEQASYDAWIKYYRPDENSVNTSVSYYTKGLVIGFLLDAKIRHLTNDARSLDDLMRLMYQRYSGATGFTPEDLRRSAAEIAGVSNGPELRRWFVQALETTEDLDYKEALDWYGLQFSPPPDHPKTSLGIRTRLDNQRTVVTEVRRGSPAAEAGITSDDQIVAINDVPVAQDQITAELARIGAGNVARITIARRGIARTLDVTLSADPAEAWSLQVRPTSTPAQSQHRTHWQTD